MIILFFFNMGRKRTLFSLFNASLHIMKHWILKPTKVVQGGLPWETKNFLLAYFSVALHWPSIRRLIIQLHRLDWRLLNGRSKPLSSQTSFDFPFSFTIFKKTCKLSAGKHISLTVHWLWQEQRYPLMF